MIVLVDAPLPEVQAERIRKLSPKFKLVNAPQFGAVLPKELLRDAEVIYTTMARFDPADAPQLRLVQTNTAATNPQANSAIWKSSVPVCNVAGAYTAAVAECAIGMLLAVTRKITLGVEFQLRSEWPASYDAWCGTDLYGKTMGIVGYGNIGRHIARIAQAMGMKVLACKRNPDRRRDEGFILPHTGDPEGVIPAAWFGENQIAEMFGQTDVAMIVLPHVPSTTRIIGTKEIAALPRHAIFASLGRGAVVDEPVLVERLKSGTLAGAALDVFEAEPLPAHSPLWKMKNVLIMPHIASWTDKQADRAAEVLIENLRRLLAGEPLVNVVDKKLMY